MLHSGLISITVTRFLQANLGERYRLYRLFFNMLAILTLIPLYFLILNNMAEEESTQQEYLIDQTSTISLLQS